MAGAENDTGDEGWDEDDELYNGNVAGAVELHNGGGGGRREDTGRTLNDGSKMTQRKL